jgi:hypothetical protein
MGVISGETVIFSGESKVKNRVRVVKNWFLEFISWEIFFISLMFSGLFAPARDHIFIASQAEFYRKGCIRPH